MEIPSQIRFDFLLVLLGFLLVIFPVVAPLGGISNVKPLLLIAIEIVGAFLMIWGIGLIRDDYLLEWELKELEYAKKKALYVDFFQTKGFITEKSKNIHEKEIKDIINA